MIGTTIETSIRIMSRWGKDGVVRTDKDGFVIVDRRQVANSAFTNCVCYLIVASQISASCAPRAR
jgi:hypothetical protein